MKLNFWNTTGVGGPATCQTPDPTTLERRGVGFIALSFLLCPCHLPLTLGVLGSLIGGTALGSALHAHPYVAGTLITLVWGTGTWFGVQQLRRATRYATGLRRALNAGSS